MFVGAKGNLTEARRVAQANANSSQRPWVVFTDTSGRMHVERLGTHKPEIISESLHPTRTFDFDAHTALQEAQVLCSHLVPRVFRLTFDLMGPTNYGSFGRVIELGEHGVNLDDDLHQYLDYAILRCREVWSTFKGLPTPTREEELVKAQAALAVAQARVDALVDPDTSFANELHRRMCRFNHTDGCSWECSSWGKPCDTRKYYLNMAKKLRELPVEELRACLDLVLGPDAGTGA